MSAEKAEESREVVPYEDNEWSIISSPDSSFTMKPTYSEYDFPGDMVPANPADLIRETMNPVMNQTHTGLTLSDAYVAFDMRESYLQRHASSLAL